MLAVIRIERRSSYSRSEPGLRFTGASSRFLTSLASPALHHLPPFSFSTSHKNRIHFRAQRPSFRRKSDESSITVLIVLSAILFARKNLPFFFYSLAPPVPHVLLPLGNVARGQDIFTMSNERWNGEKWGVKFGFGEGNWWWRLQIDFGLNKWRKWTLVCFWNVRYK